MVQRATLGMENLGCQSRESRSSDSMPPCCSTRSRSKRTVSTGRKSHLAHPNTPCTHSHTCLSNHQRLHNHQTAAPLRSGSTPLVRSHSWHPRKSDLRHTCCPAGRLHKSAQSSRTTQESHYTAAARSPLGIRSTTTQSRLPSSHTSSHLRNLSTRSRPRPRRPTSSCCMFAGLQPLNSLCSESPRRIRSTTRSHQHHSTESASPTARTAQGTCRKPCTKSSCSSMWARPEAA